MNIIDLKRKDYLVISSMSNQELSSIKLLKNNSTINIKPIPDELTYYKNIQRIFDYLKFNNKTYNVRIYVNNRELFRKSNFLEYIPKNINLIIYSNDYEYTKEEYINEEIKIEKLAKPIRESNLSPLEKYLAIYDIVKKFRLYKDNNQAQSESRNLKYVLEDNNEYIVCVGFANLLRELLNRIDIPNKFIHTNIDTSYDDKFTIEEKPLNLSGHSRNLIKIDDDKYHIHGYYLADATWDNHPKYDLYLNSLLTFDRKKEAKRLESLEDEDLLLDFHSVDEFIKKIRFYIKRKTNLPHIDEASIEKLRTKCYKDLYLKIINILKETDNEEYQKLFNKYHKLINIDTDKTNSYILEEPMTNFLTDYAKYIIPLSNNEVDIETILRAVIEVKKQIYKKNTAEIKTWLEQTLIDNKKASSIAFPYKYDESNPEAYVEARNNKR